MTHRRPLPVELALAALLVFVVAVGFGSYLVGNRRLKSEVSGAIDGIAHLTSLRRDVRRAQLAFLEWQFRDPAHRPKAEAVEQAITLALQRAATLQRETNGEAEISPELRAAQNAALAALKTWSGLSQACLRESFGPERTCEAGVDQAYGTLDHEMDRVSAQALKEGEMAAERLDRVFFRRMLLHFLVTTVSAAAAWLAFAAWHRSRTVRAQLERSESRRSDLQRMSASLAHEINNQLGIIENSLALLRRRHVESEVLDFLGDASDQIRSLTGDLTTFSRASEAPPRRVELLEVVREVAAPFDGAAKVEGAGDHWVEVDPLGLRRAVLNLLRNAIEAGGPAELTVTTQAEGVLLTCGDRGPGISSEVADRAGEPFFTTKARGMGLGLAIVSHFARGAGGRFELQNRVGGGAEARLWFPRSK